MKFKGFFITGTDTGVGKTTVTAGLLRAFLESGHKALAIKPIQTGCPMTSKGLLAEDVEVYAHATHDFFPDGYPPACGYAYPHACSPHLAAQLAHEELLLETVVETTCKLANTLDPILIEGAGGVSVPLGKDWTTLDLMQRLGLPIILVADNKLGMINHTIMSLEMLKNRGLEVAGIVINHTSPTDADNAWLRDDNIKTVLRLGHTQLLATLPYIENQTDGPKAFCHQLKAVIPSLIASQNTQEDLSFDKDHLWHPYAAAISPAPALRVISAHGNRIQLENGTELIDGMASWWCAIHGYNHPVLNHALHEQTGRMAHVMFGGLTHSPAIDLGQRLLNLAPDGLEHIFFADSGSVSVEVALKMALQFMQAQGQTQRHKIFTVRGGYHGDTFGCMSVCDPENGMHKLFTGILAEQIFAPRPGCRFESPYDPSSLEQARLLFEKHKDQIAAIIVEPIVQGAGGMWFYHPEYLSGLRALANEYNVLLILDEIATGFGRTGKMFACEWADITPDIMCVGKALTGGYMTLAATLTTPQVASTISRDGGVLMHGPTFMANPLACAVANASLSLLEQGTWKNQVTTISGLLQKGLAPCKTLPNVQDVRVLGAIGVVEMKTPVAVNQIQQELIHHGVWLRPFGKLIYCMPPYTITSNELIQLTTSIFEVIKNTTER